MRIGLTLSLRISPANFFKIGQQDTIAASEENEAVKLVGNNINKFLCRETNKTEVIEVKG